MPPRWEHAKGETLQKGSMPDCFRNPSRSKLKMNYKVGYPRRPLLGLLSTPCGVSH